MSRIFAETAILRERQLWADFGPIFARYNYEWSRFSNFAALRDFPKTNFPNHRFRRVTFWSKTTILRERQR